MTPCKSCKWAEWELTKNGRVNPHASGRCGYPVVVVLPDVVARAQSGLRDAIGRVQAALAFKPYIYREDGDGSMVWQPTCAAWEQAGTPKKAKRATEEPVSVDAVDPVCERVTG